MKKIIAFMLVLAVLLSVAQIQVLAAPADAFKAVAIKDLDTAVTVNGESYKVVRSLDELPKTAEEDGRYILANDIDCQGSTLPKTTIVLGDGAILDGNGYGILNFKLDTSGEDKGKSGLFTMSSGGTYTVRNIHFGEESAPVEIQNNIAFRSDDSTSTTTVWENVQVYMYHTRDGGLPGAFISTAKGNHTFRNCDVYFYSDAITSSKSSNVGGFVGNVADKATLTFEGCNVYGAITSINNVGGFIGYVDENKGATISFKNCNNYAKLTAKGGNGVGGFIAYQRDRTANVSFEGCNNYGVLSVTGETNINTGYAGGLIGNDCGKSVMTDCNNYANLTTYSNAGGLIGSNSQEAALTNCHNFGNVTSSADQSKIGTGAVHVGGLVGNASKASFVACGNIGTLTLNAEKSETAVFGCGNLAGNIGTWSAENSFGFGTLIGANASKGVLYGVIGDEEGVTQDNKYIMNPDNNENLNGAEGAGRVTAAAANEHLATLFPQSSFVLGDTDTPVVAEPVLKAIQMSATDAGTLRVVAAVETIRFNKAGFAYTVTYEGEQTPAVSETVYTTKAHGAIGGKEEDVSLSISAGELGGAYLYTAVISGLRTDVNATVEVKPITVLTDEAGNILSTFEGKTVSFTCKGGELIAIDR